MKREIASSPFGLPRNPYRTLCSDKKGLTR